MKVIERLVVGMLFAAPLASYATPSPAGPDNPDGSGPVAQFTVSDQTQVPGKVLKKGAYTIRVVDHLSDRMVLQVNQNGKLLSIFLALPKSALPTPQTPGPIQLNSGANAKTAIRGFKFSDGTVAEFVYPKAEAVGLAKANDTTIPAIDPASQGLSGNPALSPTDREMVTLWMLSPTPVGPNDSGPGIKAERYQPAVASGNTPPRPKAARPAVAALPHTAGPLPMVTLAGLLSLLGAAALTRRRVVANG